MLAYVFWHWPPPESKQASYATSLLDFHRSLIERRPEGFHRSCVFRVHSAPWAARDVPVYEDWYLVENFTALGLLNEGAVTGVSKAPHDRIAQRADSGAGGVYRLRAGRPAFSRVRYALWFSKPKGVPYDDFYQGVPSSAIEAGGGLWERQMVLGPAPECCVLAAEVIALHDAIETLTLAVELLWRGS